MKDKKSMVMVILVGITICLFLVFNTTVFATTGTVTASDLRLREQSSTSSNILLLLDENQEVEILSEDGDWYKIKVDNKVGYVNKQYIKVKDNTNIVSNNTTSTENNNNETKNENKNETTENKQDENKKEENNNTDTSEEAKKYQEATIKEDSNIRVMPLINGDVISTAKTNQKMIVVSNTGIWSFVKGESISGWILSKNLNIQDTTVNTQEDTSIEENENKENNEQENNQEETQVEKTENKEENKQENTTENKENEENKTTQENQNNTTEKKEEKVEQNPETTYSSKKTYYVSATSVNVRSQASKTAQVIKVLNTNNEVTVTGESGEWYIVSINGQKGYIAKTLLSTTKKEVTSRSTTSVQEQKKETTTQQNTQANNQQTQTTQSSQPAQNTQAQNTKEQTQTQTQQSTTSSSSGSAVAAYAKQFVGYPYVYGASGPRAFDCSGFALYVYKHFGYSLNRTASAQASNGVAVSKSNLQAGDLVFFNTSGGISHVGIYIGGGQFVHASTSKTGVIISSLSSSYYQQRYVTARRIVK